MVDEGVKSKIDDVETGSGKGPVLDHPKEETEEVRRETR